MDTQESNNNKNLEENYYDTYDTFDEQENTDSITSSQENTDSITSSNASNETDVGNLKDLDDSELKQSNKLNGRISNAATDLSTSFKGLRDAFIATGNKKIKRAGETIKSGAGAVGSGIASGAKAVGSGIASGAKAVGVGAVAAAKKIKETAQYEKTHPEYAIKKIATLGKEARKLHEKADKILNKGTVKAGDLNLKNIKIDLDETRKDSGDKKFAHNIHVEIPKELAKSIRYKADLKKDIEEIKGIDKKMNKTKDEHKKTYYQSALNKIAEKHGINDVNKSSKDLLDTLDTQKKRLQENIDLQRKDLKKEITSSLAKTAKPAKGTFGAMIRGLGNKLDFSKEAYAARNIKNTLNQDLKDFKNISKSEAKVEKKEFEKVVKLGKDHINEDISTPLNKLFEEAPNQLKAFSQVGDFANNIMDDKNIRQQKNSETRANNAAVSSVVPKEVTAQLEKLKESLEEGGSKYNKNEERAEVVSNVVKGASENKFTEQEKANQANKANPDKDIRI